MSALSERLSDAVAFVRSTAAAIPQTSRSLRRAPGFVAIATLSLGAALGMSTSVFALIDAMTHPVSPYSHVEQLFNVRVFGNAKISPSAKDVQDALASYTSLPQQMKLHMAPEQPIIVRRGDRIAQLLVQRVELPDLVEVTSFDEAGLADTSRGDGGHGSSGGHESL